MRAKTSGGPNSLTGTRLQYFGGSTNHWGGWCRPLDGIDFQKRDFVALSGWPLRRSELDEPYQRAQEICELGPEPFDPPPAEIVGKHLQLPDVELKTFRLSPPTRFGQRYREAIHRSRNVTCFLHSTVVEIQKPGARVEYLRVRRGSKQFSVRARAFVLALGGIDNARLLLASTGHDPRGIGNGEDFVGRCFADHLGRTVGIVLGPASQPYRWTSIGGRRYLPHISFPDEGSPARILRLAAEGSFRRLGTTHPPLSPVAWSSFMTGAHPPRHGIFDFLHRDARTYLPFLSSSEVEPVKRSITIGKFEMPLGRPKIRMLRRAKTFWQILGEHGVFSNVLRVPVTFPAEPFHGACLSGMSVPDLRGTQGSFTYFTDGGNEGEHTGGLRVPLTWEGNTARASIPGPEHPLRKDRALLELPLEITRNGSGEALVRAGSERFSLRPGEYSEWIPLTFDGGPAMKVKGIVRFRLADQDGRLGLYMTPINVDPENPAVPISHPKAYGPYLAKMNGPFCTLGLAEDTWALNERVIDEDGFLDQAYLIHEEREKQLFDALENTRQGLVVCVFDATDRVQHMFYRYTDPDPRAARPGDRDRFAKVIDDLYVHMDSMLTRIRAELDDETVLIVLSDHGFASFRRGVNLNVWFLEQGYLVLQEGATGERDYLRDVDWSKTRAYAIGLAGIYLNVMGRERAGIVGRGEEAEALKREIAGKLAKLMDPESGHPLVSDAVDLGERYCGPYLESSPDLMIGWYDGYRTSWDAAVGKVAGDLVQNNTKSWSGDHCLDPALVPGILFTNRSVTREEELSIVDIAPTVLDLYGIEAPAFMEGKPLGLRRTTA